MDSTELIITSLMTLLAAIAAATANIKKSQKSTESAGDPYSLDVETIKGLVQQFAQLQAENDKLRIDNTTLKGEIKLANAQCDLKIKILNDRINELEAHLQMSGIDVSKTIRVNLKGELRKAIDEHLSDLEIRELAFDIGIDYEKFDESAMALGLVEAANRRNLLATLVTELTNRWPRLDWPGL